MRDNSSFDYFLTETTFEGSFFFQVWRRLKGTGICSRQNADVLSPERKKGKKKKKKKKKKKIFRLASGIEDVWVFGN